MTVGTWGRGRANINFTGNSRTLGVDGHKNSAGTVSEIGGSEEEKKNKPKELSPRV